MCLMIIYSRMMCSVNCRRLFEGGCKGRDVNICSCSCSISDEWIRIHGFSYGIYVYGILARTGCAF